MPYITSESTEYIVLLLGCGNFPTGTSCYFCTSPCFCGSMPTFLSVTCDDNQSLTSLHIATLFPDWSTFTFPASQSPVTLILYIYGSTFPGILCWTCDHWKWGITWSSDVGQQTPSIPAEQITFSCWMFCTGKIFNISVNEW